MSFLISIKILLIKYLQRFKFRNEIFKTENVTFSELFINYHIVQIISILLLKVSYLTVLYDYSNFILNMHLIINVL